MTSKSSLLSRETDVEANCASTGTVTDGAEKFPSQSADNRGLSRKRWLSVEGCPGARAEERARGRHGADSTEARGAGAVHRLRQGE